MHLVLLVEEQSMEALLQTLLPRLLPYGCSHDVHAFRCKTDLKRKVAARLRAYAKWLPDDWRILVLVDRDRDDCRVLKEELEGAARGAGLRTASGDERWQVANRIVIEELEAWYFGDWRAVLRAFPRVSPTVPDRRGYRDPDAIAGTWEAFERILHDMVTSGAASGRPRPRGSSRRIWIPNRTARRASPCSTVPSWGSSPPQRSDPASPRRSSRHA